jgi:hypothetical protein
VVDGLIDECINNLIETVSRIRNGERFHDRIVPKHLFAIVRVQHGQMWLTQPVIARFGNNLSAAKGLLRGSR